MVPNRKTAKWAFRWECRCNTILTRLWRMLHYPLFARVGTNVLIDRRGSFTFATITLGDSVLINRGATLWASESAIIIGNKVVIGPYVTMMGGNHNFRTIGKYIFDVEKKEPDDDQDIVIEDDVWIGAHAVILKGVRLGRGSIVGAGAVVTKAVAPYSIVGGNPAKLIRQRWTEEEIAAHERRLGQTE